MSGTRGSDLFTGISWIRPGTRATAPTYTNTEPRFILLVPGPSGPEALGGRRCGLQFYPVILQAHQIIATVPAVQPAYSAKEAAALVGRRPDRRSLDLHDDRRRSRHGRHRDHAAGADHGGPGYCVQEGWRYIVALLDSANAQLMSAGSTPLPVKLPDGYKAVAATGATFSAFNRALAGKAGLEPRVRDRPPITGHGSQSQLDGPTGRGRSDARRQRDQGISALRPRRARSTDRWRLRARWLQCAVQLQRDLRRPDESVQPEHRDVHRAHHDSVQSGHDQRSALAQQVLRPEPEPRPAIGLCRRGVGSTSMVCIRHPGRTSRSFATRSSISWRRKFRSGSRHYATAASIIDNDPPGRRWERSQVRISGRYDRSERDGHADRPGRRPEQLHLQCATSSCASSRSRPRSRPAATA